MQITLLRLPGLLVAFQLAAATALADIDLRVEAWPNTEPVDVYARVSQDGTSVSGLSADAFAVTLDGQAVDGFTLTLPPSQDPTQRISVVLVVMDSTGVEDFLRQLTIGDYVSIVTFRDDRVARYAPIDVQPFTQIDGGTGTGILTRFLADIYRRDLEDFRPAIPDLSLAIRLAIHQFEAPGLTLPEGPKAIVVLQRDYLHSLGQQSDVVASANSGDKPIFTVYQAFGIPFLRARFESLAEATGGVSFPVTGESPVSQALDSIRLLLNEAYRIGIPAIAEADCNQHLLEVAAQLQSASIAFTPCDTTPDDPKFADKLDVPLDTIVISDPVTITGMEGAATVNVFDGEYSIGCAQSFKSNSGWVQPGEQVCVRHTSSRHSYDTVSTLLVVGGVLASFTSQTLTPPPPPSPRPPPPAGGGGPTGLLELLAAAGLLLSRRRVSLAEPRGRAVLLAAAIFVAGPSQADIDLRVESRPIPSPIETFVRVTEGGKSVIGLEQADFALTLDGRPISRFAFRPPPDQDPAQHLSIVLVLADGRAVESAIPAIAQLPEGSFVTLLRARYQPGDPTPWLVLHPFTVIDGSTGSQSLAEFLQLSIHDLAMLRYGSRTPHLDFLDAGLDQLETPGTPLPPGPKAIILVGNGRHVESWSGRTQSEVTARANALGVPVFTIGTVDFSDRPEVSDFMSALARDTGGKYLRGHDIETLRRAYLRIWRLLGGAYRLAIASARVADCNPHMLEVTVLGETASAPFVRCDTTPEPLVFRTRDGVRPDRLIVSDAATISGIESPVEISVYGGGYSLGCDSSFTRSPGIARAGDLVCVRHRTSTVGGELTTTALVVGGVASYFHSTTRVAAP